MNTPEVQTQSVERQVNLVDDPTISVEVVYFDEQPERNTTDHAATEEPRATFGANPEDPLGDLIDYTALDLASVQAEPLYVWAGDSPADEAPAAVRPAERGAAHGLWPEAEGWELAA